MCGVFGGASRFGLPSHARHTATLLGATATSFGTSPAMVHVLVLLAFLRAIVAGVRAQLAEFGCPLAAAGHDDGCRPAELRALEVECNTPREHLHVGFVQTGSGTMLALECAFIARVDATAHGFVGHGPMLLENSEASRTCDGPINSRLAGACSRVWGDCGPDGAEDGLSEARCDRVHPARDPFALTPWPRASPAPSCRPECHLKSLPNQRRVL
jgi:hypothetical protein